MRQTQLAMYKKLKIILHECTSHDMDSLVPYRRAPLEDLVNSLKSVTFYVAYEFNTSNERSK